MILWAKINNCSSWRRVTGNVLNSRYKSGTRDRHGLSPTSDAVHFHLMRVHYQTIMICRNAHCATPELPSPAQMGWSKNDDSGLQPILMSLSPIPESCLEMISCACRKRRCNCRKSRLRSTSMCTCQQQSDEQKRCMNTMWFNLTQVVWHSWMVLVQCTCTEGQ